MLIKNYFKNLKKEFRNQKFTGISLDSRKIKKGYIFFALKGKSDSGKKYIFDAIKKGATTVISDHKFQGFKNNILYLKFNNPRKLLAQVVSKIYYNKPLNLIGVTGTNGKSSVANFFFQILKLNKKKVASIGTLGVNYNNSSIKTENTTLDPITLHKRLELLKKKKISNVILEASSHGLKQFRLHGLKFNIGIFTNLSRDHLDYHKSYKDYLKSKLILFKELLKKNSKIIYDKEISESKIIEKIIRKKKLKSISIGNNNCDFYITKHEFIKNKQAVNFVYKNKKYYFETNLIGKIQIKNLIMAIIAANNCNISISKILKCIDKVKSVNGRLEKVGNIKNSSKVILDYAHTPDALKTTLLNLKEQFKYSSISVVFGCGGERDRPKRPIMGKIANDICNKIYLTDDNPRKENPKKIRYEIKKNIENSKLIEISSRKKSIAKAIANLESGNILLVAGKGHEDYQEYFKKKFFSDKYYILKNIKNKNKNLFNSLKLNIINEQKKIKNINRSQKINRASINSKDIKKNDIFIAIKGKNNDGSKFANEAIKNGANLAIIEKNTKKYSSKKIKVSNSLNFLTKASSKIRNLTQAKIIAITGSSGKTSLKELVVHSLSKIANTSFSLKSFNNKYGVPLSLFNINLKDEYGVFEAGMDRKGEINYLSKLIKPHLGVITNVSYAHIKNFKNLNEIALAKSEIIHNIIEGGTIVLNADDRYFNFFKKIAKKKKLNIFSFSMKKKNTNVKFHRLTKKKKNYLLILKMGRYKKKFQINENLKPYIYNILATVTIISHYVDKKNISENLFNDFKIPDGRGDSFKINIKNKKIYIIDESYNSNPLSLEFALNKFNLVKTKPNKKFLLLGDMLELGKFTKKLHIQISKIINKSKINKVYVYGKHIKSTFNKIKTHKKGKILNNSKDIFKLIKNDLKNNDYLMIKGSNSTGLNMITKKIKLGKLNVI